MKRPSLLLLLPLLAACQVTVVPAATPAAGASPKPGAVTSPKPGTGTPKPGPSGPASPAGDAVPGPIDEVALPPDARTGEPVELAVRVMLSNGCITFADATAEADQAARRVTISARVHPGPPDVGCTMAVGYHTAKVTFTPEAPGAWTIVAESPNREPREQTLHVILPGASAAPTAAPSASPAPDGWGQEPLAFTSLTPPAGAKAGVPTTVGFEARIGSSSCARFEAATATVDAAARKVVLAGTKRVAPPGTACTKDLRSHTGEVATTLPTAGTWTLEAPGVDPVTFEVAP